MFEAAGSGAGVVRRRSRLADLLDPGGFDDEGVAAELGRVADVKSQLAAYEVSLVVRLAELRPDHLACGRGRGGRRGDGGVSGRAFPGVSEFFVDELAVVLNSSRRYAQSLAETALALRGLPGTWAALADGVIDWPWARVPADVLGWQAPQVDAGVIAACEAELLPRAGSLSVGRFAGAGGDGVAGPGRGGRGSAAGAGRAPGRCAGAGRVRRMATLEADLPTPLAQACRAAVDSYARMVKAAGDPRSIGQLRAGVLADLILRPWDTARPPVTADLTVIAPLPTLFAGSAVPPAPGVRTVAQPAGGGGECAEVGGEPITAAHLRELLAQLDAVCPGGLQVPAGGSLQVALVDPGTGALAGGPVRWSV